MSRILGTLLDMQRFGQGQGNQLFDTGLSRWGQAVQFDAEDASRRRQQASQRRLEIENRKAQVHQANKARADSWTKFGIGAAGSAAGGALVGSMAAAQPAAAIATPPIEAASVAGESAINPAAEAAATQMAGVQSAAEVNPLNMSAINYGMDTTVPTRMATGEIATRATAPATTAFAGGNRALGGLYGAGLGLAGGVSGQNFLGPAIDMPYDNAMQAARLTNVGLNSTLTGERIATEAALRNPRVDTEVARAGAQRSSAGASDASARERDARAKRTETLLPYEVDTEANRAGSYGALTDQRIAQAGAANELADTRRTTRPDTVANLRARLQLLGAQTKKAEAEAAAGGAARKPSLGYIDTESRIGDASSIDDAVGIIDAALKSKAISPAEAADLKRRLGK